MLVASFIFFSLIFTTGVAYIFVIIENQIRIQEAGDAALKREVERESEDLYASAYVLGDGDLGVSILNTGPISVQLTQVMVLDANGSLLKDIREPTLPITLSTPHLTATTIDTNVTIESEAEYSAKVITARGTQVVAEYPPPSFNVTYVVESEVAKAIGSVSMDSTTLEYSQDGGNTWNEGWLLPGGEDTVFRVNVTNWSDNDIFVANYSSFLFMRIVTGGGGQILPRVFYITTSPNGTTYPALEDPLFLSKGGVKIPSDGESVVLYLKLDAVGNGFGQELGDDAQYFTILEIFGKTVDPITGEPYGQSLPFVGVRTIE